MIQKKVLSLLGAASLIAILFACPKPVPQNPPCQEMYLVEFLGMNEVPPTNDSASGAGTLLINISDSTAIFSVFVHPLDSLTGFHFHLGSIVENGPIIVNLARFVGDFRTLPQKVLAQRTEFSKVDFVGPATGMPFSWFVNAVRDSMIYSNAHTVNFRSGATRGQVLPFD